MNIHVWEETSGSREHVLEDVRVLRAYMSRENDKFYERTCLRKISFLRAYMSPTKVPIFLTYVSRKKIPIFHTIISQKIIRVFQAYHLENFYSFPIIHDCGIIRVYRSYLLEKRLISSDHTYLKTVRFSDHKSPSMIGSIFRAFR